MLRVCLRSCRVPIGTRSKLILPRSHPFEYFKSDWNATTSPVRIVHPKPSIGVTAGRPTPLYFKITLTRSLIGMPWQTRYIAGVLFRKVSPRPELKPKLVDPRVNTHSTLFREASPEVTEMCWQLKELLHVEPIWTEEQYRDAVRPLLGKNALTDDELQQRRGVYVVRRHVQPQPL